MTEAEKKKLNKLYGQKTSGFSDQKTATVYDYFQQRMGVAPDEFLRLMEADSVIGKICLKLIDQTRAIITPEHTPEQRELIVTSTSTLIARIGKLGNNAH